MWTHSCVYVRRRNVQIYSLLHELCHTNKKGTDQNIYTQVDWKVSLAGTAGSTADWYKVTIREGVNQTAVVCHTDPLIPTQAVLPGQHFSQQLLQKMTKPARYFYWSVVLLLTSLSLPFSSDSLLLFPYLTLCPSSWVQAHLVYSKECSNPLSCIYSTVCVCFCLLIVSPCIDVTVT